MAKGGSAAKLGCLSMDLYSPWPRGHQLGLPTNASEEVRLERCLEHLRAAADLLIERAEYGMAVKVLSVLEVIGGEGE